MNFYEIDENTILYGNLMITREGNVINFISLVNGDHTFSIIDDEEGTKWAKLMRMAI